MRVNARTAKKIERQRALFCFGVLMDVLGTQPQAVIDNLEQILGVDSADTVLNCDNCGKIKWQEYVRHTASIVAYRLGLQDG